MKALVEIRDDVSRPCVAVKLENVSGLQHHPFDDAVTVTFFNRKPPFTSLAPQLILKGGVACKLTLVIVSSARSLI